MFLLFTGMESTSRRGSAPVCLSDYFKKVYYFKQLRQVGNPVETSGSQSHVAEMLVKHQIAATGEHMEVKPLQVFDPYRAPEGTNLSIRAIAARVVASDQIY